MPRFKYSLNDYVETAEYLECCISCGRPSCNVVIEETYYETDYLDATKRLARKASGMGWTCTSKGPRCHKHGKK